MYKITVGFLITIVLFFSGCNTNQSNHLLGEIYDEGDDCYRLVLETGDVYVSFPEARWFPNTVFNDELSKAIAYCDFNGKTYVYATSSSNCVYIRNRRETRKPIAYLFPVDMQFPEINGENVSKINLKLHSDGQEEFASREAISDKKVIEEFFNLVLDKSKHIKILKSDFYETVDGIGYLILKCRKDPGLQAYYGLVQAKNGAVYAIVEERCDENMYVCVEINSAVLSYNWF